MTTIEHDLSLDHGKGNYWNLACPRCRRAYDVYRATRLDPLRPPETDEEPCCEFGDWGHIGPCGRFDPKPEPVTREWSRWAAVLCVASMVLIALYLGRHP